MLVAGTLMVQILILQERPIEVQTALLRTPPLKSANAQVMHNWLTLEVFKKAMAGLRLGFSR